MERQNVWFRLAQVPVCVRSAANCIKKRYSEYLIEPSPEDKAAYAAWRRACGEAETAPISIGAAEKAAEREIAGEGAPDEYYAEMALWRKICDGLLWQGVLLFHGSAVELDGRAYIFAAPSGTGKSTHAQLWQEYFDSRLARINDDKPLLRFEDGGVAVYGSPYGGKDNIHANISAPLAGIAVLHQAKLNSARRLSAAEAYPLLFKQAYRSGSSPEAMVRVMELARRLTAVPIWALGCDISRQAVETAYNALARGEPTKEGAASCSSNPVL